MSEDPQMPEPFEEAFTAPSHAAPTTVDNSFDAAAVTATVSPALGAASATADAGSGHLGTTAPLLQREEVANRLTDTGGERAELSPTVTTIADVPPAFAAQADGDQHFAEITVTAFPAVRGTCT